MRKLFSFFMILAAFFCMAASPRAVASPETRDDNRDGVIDKWIERGTDGSLLSVADDGKKKDGKPHHWVYYQAGSVFKREWDRNGDGRADLRILEQRKRFIEKSYDDNFDGTFDRTERAPKRGSSGKISQKLLHPNQPE